MQSSRFSSSSLPSEYVPPLSPAIFPNASSFAPIFAGRQAPPATSNAVPAPDAAFFSEFASSLAETVKRLTSPTAEVLFDRFGFATLDDFARRFESETDGAPKTLHFTDERGARHLLLAPSSTFRLLFDAALGFDVAKICANEALWNDFNADASTPLTPFEEEAFADAATRFAPLSPVAAFSSTLTAAVSFRQTLSRAALELDAPLFYWERRFVRISNRLFPWTLVFPTRFLASLLPRDFSEPTPRFAESPRSQQPSTLRSDASAVDFVSTPENNFELAVVVERGEMSAEAWRRLKPGDVLTTNVPANALFLGLVNDAPRFLCRPGLFRGAAAVQIKSRADDDRE